MPRLQPPGQLFDKAANVLARWRGREPGPYTDSQRRAEHGVRPGLQTLDAAPGRSVAIGEGVRLHLRMETFDSLNRVNPGTPNRFVNTAQFGTITESSMPGRQVQLRARLSF
ncbi:MAG TPA: hypothetical protein VG297_03385 [Bryobacteraceae bacterium]|nr:hypothetical protein [Bryobacteraceae bacterium]